MLAGVQSGNEIPHDICNICGIAHAHTSRKDYIFMERQRGQIITCILERGQGTCKKSRAYPAQAYTTVVVLVSNIRHNIRHTYKATKLTIRFFLHQIKCK